MKSITAFIKAGGLVVILLLALLAGILYLEVLKTPVVTEDDYQLSDSQSDSQEQTPTPELPNSQKKFTPQFFVDELPKGCFIDNYGWSSWVYDEHIRIRRDGEESITLQKNESVILPSGKNLTFLSDEGNFIVKIS